MELTIKKNPLPLKKDQNGVIRVGGTRVTLTTILSAFNNGSTCEEIVFQYPVLNLADIYEVISYYLRNREVVDAYLEEHKIEAEHTQDKIETKFNPHGIRERLLSRRAVNG